MKTTIRFGHLRLCAVVALGLLVAGCTGTRSFTADEPPSGQVLNTSETAPADLQLTCSSAAATQFGLPLDKVLPVSSSKLPDGTYDVRLTSEGRNYACLVDDNANVLSVGPV